MLCTVKLVNVGGRVIAKRTQMCTRVRDKNTRFIYTCLYKQEFIKNVPSAVNTKKKKDHAYGPPTVDNPSA